MGRGLSAPGFVWRFQFSSFNEVRESFEGRLNERAG